MEDKLLKVPKGRLCVGRISQRLSKAISRRTRSVRLANTRRYFIAKQTNTLAEEKCLPMRLIEDQQTFYGSHQSFGVRIFVRIRVSLVY